MLGQRASFRRGDQWISPVVWRGIPAGGRLVYSASGRQHQEYRVFCSEARWQGPVADGCVPAQSPGRLAAKRAGLRLVGRVGWMGRAGIPCGRGFSAGLWTIKPGPPDCCGPVRQLAVSSVEGISRGALIAGLLAQADPSIAGVVLVSGLFDLPSFAAEANTLTGTLIVQTMRSEAGGDDQELVARSMLRSSAKIRANVLILNGACHHLSAVRPSDPRSGTRRCH